MNSLIVVLQEGERLLQKSGLPDAKRSAEELLAYLLGFSRLDLYLHHDLPLEEQEMQSYWELIAKRAKRMPLQYLCGSVPFYHVQIEVTPDVLIPRSETELMVDKVVQTLKKEDLKGKVLVDLCSGSGCIGIAIKKALPDVAVVLSDLSFKALEVAKRNAEKNGVDVRFRQGDLLENFSEKIDFLVCNPPYIAVEEAEELQEEVRDFEPHLALFAKDGGYEFYQRLARILPSFLHPKAKLFFEIGEGQKEGIQKIFKEAGWSAGQFFCDWNGKNRFFFLENE